MEFIYVFHTFNAEMFPAEKCICFIHPHHIVFYHRLCEGDLIFCVSNDHDEGAYIPPVCGPTDVLNYEVSHAFELTLEIISF